MEKKNFGMIGLGVMGENLALNILSKGWSVAGYDLDPAKRATFEKHAAGKPAVAASSISEFLAALESPRRIVMLVPAGKAVDSLIGQLRPLLAPGDIVIDAGNSHYPDTARRLVEIESTGILYVGTGVSGGEEGALRGPSIMPGGDAKAWPFIKPVFQSIAARSEDGTPCCDWIGPGGSGHFVKMVHNGIEYADMQMICEAYFLLDRLLGMSPAEERSVFQEWNGGELNSYLVEITADILAKNDPDTGRPLVSMILDTAEQKGTGKWTSQAALDLGVPALTIADAVFARMVSALKAERVNASTRLTGPKVNWSGDRREFQEKIRQALFCAKICAYAQGFQLLRAADVEYGWRLDPGRIAMLWRAGCIIRAQFLDKIRDAYQKDPGTVNLLLDPYFSEKMTAYQASWRSVIAEAVQNGIPVPAFMSALSYYDSYRSAVLPANLLQAQRDYFGAHTYRRTDRDGVFHTRWT